MELWDKWRYKHITLLLLGIFLSIILSRVEALNSFLLNLGTLRYIGAFLGGALFVSTFSIGTGVLILLRLAKTLHPLEIGILAGMGAVLADFMFFRYARNGLKEEIVPIYNRLGGTHLTKFLNHKHLRWTIPVIGALIIASPLPDEIGAGILGITRIKTYQFLILSWVVTVIVIKPCCGLFFWA